MREHNSGQSLELENKMNAIKYLTSSRMKHLQSILLQVTIAWLYSSEANGQSSTFFGGQPWPIPGIIEAEDCPVIL